MKEEPKFCKGVKDFITSHENKTEQDSNISQERLDRVKKFFKTQCEFKSMSGSKPKLGNSQKPSYDVYIPQSRKDYIDEYTDKCENGKPMHVSSSGRPR